MHNVQNIFYARFDVVYFFGKCFCKEFLYGEIHLVARDDLAADGHREAALDMNGAFFGFEVADDQFEYRRFACAVLPHERHLRTFAQRKIRFAKNGRTPIFKGNLIKSHNNLIVQHVA